MQAALIDCLFYNRGVLQLAPNTVGGFYYGSYNG